MTKHWVLLILLTYTASCACLTRATPAPAPHLDVPHATAIELVRITKSPADGVVHDFYLGRFEVTNQQYAAFIQATHYDGSDHPSSVSKEVFLQDWVGGTYPRDQGNHPVCYLNVHHARAYCAWLTQVTGRHVRLPSDAEWSLAAMGPGLKRTFPWGDTFDRLRTNIGGADDGFTASSPVGTFLLGATSDGIFDMAGNIWEWTSSPTPPPPPANYGGNLRGGPWCMGSDSVRSAFIAHEDPDRCDDKFGLRILVEIPESK